MNNGVWAAKHPVIGVCPLDPHPGLVRGDDRGSTQRRHGLLAPGLKAILCAPEQVHQPALADGKPEQVSQRGLQALVGERLEGLEIGRHRMQAGSERRALDHRGPRPHDARPAGGTADGETPVMRDAGLPLRQLDPLVHADRLGRQVQHQGASTAGTLVRTVLNNLIRRVACHPGVALVAGFRSARLGSLPLRFAIRRGRLGGGARGLLWPLQTQDQFDQLGLAQTLKLVATHPTLESA
jgi:hypothetical protein